MATSNIELDVAIQVGLSGSFTQLVGDVVLGPSLTSFEFAKYV